MRINIEIGENTYESIIDIDRILIKENHPEEYPEDFSNELFEEDRDNTEPWLVSCLLDVEAFKQYKSLSESEDDEKEEHYRQILEQYEKIDEIIMDSLVNVSLFHSFLREEMDAFNNEFADFVEDISYYLQLRDPLSIYSRRINVPESENPNIEPYLNDIRLILYNRDEYDRINWGGEPINLSVYKNRIRENIVKIAENLSEESKRRYQTLRFICRLYECPDIFTYDCARLAVCPRPSYPDIARFESGISYKVSYAFNKRLEVLDFLGGDAESKINEINKYFDDRDYIKKGMDNYNDMTGKLRRYFQRRRCVAIMEFPQNDSDNMFSLSGKELNGDKTYNVAFENRIAMPIKKELKLIGHYLFCRQTVQVRRYGHKELDNSITKLPSWIYLDSDLSWDNNIQDYSCCERKFLAKLENDHSQGSAYPTDIELWTRFKICDNCDWAIEDYEKTNSAKITIIK